MRVESLSFDLEELAGVAPAPVRPPGLHLSALIREMERVRLGSDKRPESTPDTARAARGYWELGLLWEVAFELAMAIRYTSDRPLVRLVKGQPVVRRGPGREVWLRQWAVQDEETGIWMTPDVYDVRAGRIVETKWTTKSMRNADEGAWEKWFWGWLVQMMAYCRYWETREAELVVMFANGDWRFKQGTAKPTARRWLFRFDDRDIDSNWRRIVYEADEWKRCTGPRGKSMADRAAADERANAVYRRLPAGELGKTANAERRRQLASAAEAARQHLVTVESESQVESIFNRLGIDET